MALLNAMDQTYIHGGQEKNHIDQLPPRKGETYDFIDYVKCW